MSLYVFGAALSGFATAFSLILAIGAQNAFVLRQGLLGQHVFSLALLCALSDAILIAAGVAGFGYLVEKLPSLPMIMSLAGAAFLFIYGAMRLVAAWKGEYALEVSGISRGLWPTLAIGAAFTWANPHVYLDTLGLIGAVSTGYEGRAAKLAFGTGAISASFTFFFGLAYGARLLAPIMSSPRAWRWLDTGIGLVMWLIATGLLVGLF
ncbi:MAG: amino acid transporter [Rhodobacteraceae bacterium]|nr:amino acid transporter [Paracoccaceae bacterium]